MKKKGFLPLFCLLALLLGAVLVIYRMPWGFARQVGIQEETLRMEVVQTAENWLGANEKDGTHRAIIDLYNSHAPLARGYPMTYEDAWCAAFDSAVAIQCGLTDIIPTECGCDRQIDLFQELGAWEEADDYVPIPGDFVFYHWDCVEVGDCTASTDHVGIVVGTKGRLIKVIEGNKDNDVSHRITFVNAPGIRGYGIPHYNEKLE